MSSSVKSARVNGNGVPALKVESAPPSSGLSVDGSIMSPGGSVASTPPTYNKKLLIEIVSCRDLLPTHKSGFSNPYAKIRFGNSDKHKTSYIEKTLNPCFLPKHKNTYILKASPRDVYAKKGIELVVQDHDTFAFSDNDIGVAKVSAEELYLADGEDMELKLDPPKDSKLFLNGQKAGYITIRVREATQGDKDVIKARSGLFKKARRKSKTEVKRGVDGLDFVDMDEKILLVEILSCRELLASDKDGSSDPYVKVKLGNQQIHKTDIVHKNLNPKFTSKEKNSFVIDCSISELYGSQGIFINVKDWDRGVGGNDHLGSVRISAEDLYACTEKEYHLDSPPGKNEDAGFITLRTEAITEEERETRKKGLLSVVKKPPIPKLLSFQNKKKEGAIDTTLVIEVVSCKDLRPGVGLDLTVDPFVVVFEGDEEVHRTEALTNNQNPIYTIGKGGVFLFDLLKKDFLAEEKGLTFRIRDWDPLAADELGYVTVSAKELLEAKGERMKLKVLPPDRSKLAPGALLGAAAGVVGGVGGAVVGGAGAVVGGAGKVGGKAVGLAGKGIKKVGDNKLAKGVGKVAMAATKPVGNVVAKRGSAIVSGVKAGGGAVIGGVKAGGGALVSGVKGGVGAIKDLNPLASQRADDDYGYITIRCREATSYDKKFLKFAEEQKGDFLGCRQNIDFVFDTKGGYAKLLSSTKMSIVEKVGPDAGVEKFLVRPEPDPKRPAVTKYLSEAEINAEALEPSREWLYMGSGTTGRLFVEVIGCDGLPNLDTLSKTDSFAMVVFEDAFGKTDVIDDCLSPRYMPWSRRAFMFCMEHPSSDLRVGIFDFDNGSGTLIGRVCVQVSTLRPETEYNLTYNLYEDSETPERVPKGTVTLRLRVEFGSPKQVVMANLSPPVEQFINFQNPKHLQVAQKVVEGNNDITSYGIGTLTMHITELTEYLNVTYYISDAVISLLFWRGQVQLFKKIMIPLHSMIAFVAAITFVERPTLCFSYFWFGNAWLLLAIQNWRNNLPHAWNRTTPFSRILMMMVLDKAAGPELIPANFQEMEAKEYEEYMAERIRKAEEAALKRYEENNKLYAETAELDQVGDTDISTKKSSLADYASPFKSILYPIQQLLWSICGWLRIVRNIYLWDEQYYAALLTAASIAVGLVFYILPWGFILRWTGRLVAWLVFGPHMKLVDMFYYSKLKEATEEEEAKKMAEYYKQLKETAQKNAEIARIRTEEAVKQKSVKEILFGKFIERVPVLKSERFIDLPLHISYAKKYIPPSEEPVISHVGGQALVGTIIPEIRSIKDEKDAKAKKDAEQASKSGKAEEAKVKRV